MIAKTKPLFIGAALLVSGGVANAGDPMVLSTDQLDNVTAGGIVTFDVDINKVFNIDENISETKTANFNVVVNVDGNSAVAEGTSDAVGSDTDAQTFTFTQAVENQLSQSASKSIALVN